MRGTGGRRRGALPWALEGLAMTLASAGLLAAAVWALARMAGKGVLG